MNLNALTTTLALGANASFLGAIELASQSTLFFDQMAGTGLPADVTLSDTIIGEGAVIKADSGTTTFTGTNTYAGGTTLSAGTLAVAADANLGATMGGLTFTGGTLDTTTGFATGRAVTLSTTGRVQVDTGTTTLSGVVSDTGNGALAKIGAGTLVLSNANTYAGGTTIAVGTLSISTDGNLGAATGGLTFFGGTLETTATLASGRAITLADNDTVQVDTGTTTLSGVVSDTGTGALAKTGAGTLILTGDNSYSVRTTISAGTLSISADANLGATSAELTFAGGILETTATLTSGRTIGLNADGYVQVDAGTTTFTNVIRGTFPVVKTGAGTLVLSGANTYGGGTTISAGTLSISDDGNLGATSGNVILAGGTLETSATVTSGRAVSLTASSTLKVDAGVTTTLSGQVSSGSYTLTKGGVGTLVVSNGSDGFNAALQAGTLDVAAQTRINTITFSGTSTSPAILMLETAAQPSSGGKFAGTLTDFGANDSLDLVGLSYASGDTATVSGTTLTFTDAGSGKTERFTLGGTHDSAYYVHDAGANGVVIDDLPCFASGTRIRTTRGDVAVERLAAGDLAVTVSGAARPIRWLGHRTIDCRRHPRPREAMPIRISADALGTNRPACDLFVSPGHSICVDILGEVLIPASALVNGATIQQVEVDMVEYWHVELDSHDVLIANGLPAESYLDMGNRDFFVENDVVAVDDVSPDADRRDLALCTHADFCRPFHDAGALVEVVRAQLARRAKALGWRLEAGDPFAGLHLDVDGVRVDPVTRGLAARFLVPAGARDVWLESTTSRPCEIADSIDDRDLGICIGALTVDDGFGAARDLDLADPLLCIGFHAPEATCRWTAGRARLPAALWADAPDAIFLRVDLASPALPRWAAVVASDASDTTTAGITCRPGPGSTKPAFARRVLIASSASPAGGYGTEGNGERRAPEEAGGTALAFGHRRC